MSAPIPMAFPRPDTYHANGQVEYGDPGMTLRDWFAGQERISADDSFSWEVLEAIAGPRPTGNWSNNPLAWLDWSAKWQAEIKYRRADAMLAARSNEGREP